jgi:hypothetical protein
MSNIDGWNYGDTKGGGGGGGGGGEGKVKNLGELSRASKIAESEFLVSVPFSAKNVRVTYMLDVYYSLNDPKRPVNSGAGEGIYQNNTNDNETTTTSSSSSSRNTERNKNRDDSSSPPPPPPHASHSERMEWLINNCEPAAHTGVALNSGKQLVFRIPEEGNVTFDVYPYFCDLPGKVYEFEVDRDYYYRDGGGELDPTPAVCKYCGKVQAYVPGSFEENPHPRHMNVLLRLDCVPMSKRDEINIDFLAFHGVIGETIVVWPKTFPGEGIGRGTTTTTDEGDDEGDDGGFDQDEFLDYYLIGVLPKLEQAFGIPAPPRSKMGVYGSGQGGAAACLYTYVNNSVFSKGYCASPSLYDAYQYYNNAGLSSSSSSSSSSSPSPSSPPQSKTGGKIVDRGNSTDGRNGASHEWVTRTPGYAFLTAMKKKQQIPPQTGIRLFLDAGDMDNKGYVAYGTGSGLEAVTTAYRDLVSKSGFKLGTNIMFARYSANPDLYRQKSDPSRRLPVALGFLYGERLTMAYSDRGTVIRFVDIYRSFAVGVTFEIPTLQSYQSNGALESMALQ